MTDNEKELFLRELGSDIVWLKDVMDRDTLTPRQLKVWCEYVLKKLEEAKI